MDPEEHFLIISAGDSIHKTYPAVLEGLRTVTHTIVFAEKEVYTNSARDDTRKRMWKCAIRNAVDEVNAISIARNISCALVTINAATFDAIRDPVLGIFSDHPDARYSFDISAGPKRLSLGLFSMALWVEGDCYYAFGSSKARRVPLPTLPIKYLPTNPHNLVILTILFRGLEQGKKTSTLVPETTLFNETRAWQIPVRNVDEEPAGHELRPEEFSRLVSVLVGWNLIREGTDPAHGQDKFYSITPDGELALIVYSARIKKRGVESTPGLT
ncbi:MAG: hypothetical protein M0R30_08025 [Methanoregula sp.]|jgi:hypothetical protein|uniref:hypothetical protein n=1 Tax=Methanoregula sp. TaxID=2052170 RepID=UPI0025F53E84|nr:hypothetical protein [Methanoregula sp.]MCK9631577.1 hypothetical protein [Methanoregula sp.]